MYDTEDARYEAAQDAAYDAAHDARDAAIKDCMENCPGFAWRWRICQGSAPMNRKKHLMQWCEDAIAETLDAYADAAAYHKDIYKYHGVSRSDFM